MNRLVRLLIRDLKGSVGLSWHLLASQLVMPIVYIFIMGLTFANIIGGVTIGGARVSYVQYLAIGVVFGQLMLSASYAGAMVFFDKKMGMFEQILAGPFRRWEYFLSKILSVILQGLFGSSVVILIASPLLIGLTPTFKGIIYTLFSLIFASLFFGSLSLLISAYVKTDQTLNIVFNSILPPLTFVSSIFYPIEAMPEPLKYIALINPLTYVADMTRYGLFGITSTTILYAPLLLVTISTITFALAMHAAYKISL
jgi:ABC-2 type transport system permease protein